MKVRIQRRGNSLAVRIPKSFAAEVQMQQETEVELSINQGRPILSPAPPRAATLDELLGGVPPPNLRGEFETGPAVGAEAW